MIIPERTAVAAAKAVEGGDPKESVGVLNDTADIGLGEAVFDGPDPGGFREPGIGRAGVSREGVGGERGACAREQRRDAKYGE